VKGISLIVAAVAFAAFSSVAAINILPEAWAGNSTEAQSIAAKQTVTFAIEKMTCAVCPITARKAMERVEGVKSVAVDFDAKTATVVFDPAVTTPDQIGAASANAGYPASPASYGLTAQDRTLPRAGIVGVSAVTGYLELTSKDGA